MWNQSDLHKNDNEMSHSSLNGLMRDVDSYISELNAEQPQQQQQEQQQKQQPYSITPTRAHSLQSPQRQQSPIMANRANTTYRPNHVCLFSIFSRNN